MAIVRLSIEVLQGERDGDTPESRSDAVAELKHLQAEVGGIDGIIVYPEDEPAPWGVPNRPDTFNLDFDTNLPTEAEVDGVALDAVTAYLLSRPSTA